MQTDFKTTNTLNFGQNAAWVNRHRQERVVFLPLRSTRRFRQPRWPISPVLGLRTLFSDIAIANLPIRRSRHHHEGEEIGTISLLPALVDDGDAG